MLRKVLDVCEMLWVSGAGRVLRLNAASNALLSNMRPYLILESLIALEKVGVLAALADSNGLDLRALDELDRHYLKRTMDYLFSVGVVDVHDSGKFAMNPHHSNLLDAVYTTMAYQEPVRALDKLIERKITYGADTVRDGYYDAVATERFTSLFLYPFVARILSRHHIRSVCDLGCGTGGFPAFLSRDESFADLYGLDLSEEAINEGKSKGYASKNVHLFCADVLDTDVWAKEIKSQLDAFTIMLVLHEFEDRNVLRILEGLSRSFAPTKIVLVELTYKTPEQIRRMKSVPRAEVDFIHHLSMQIIRAERQWITLFEESGYSLNSNVRHEMSSTQVLVFEPSTT